MTDRSTAAEQPPAREPDQSVSTPPVELAGALSQMSGLLLSRETVQSALELVTALARTVTAGTFGAGVTVVDEHGKRSLAASNEAVERADALQYEMDEGPCLTAWRTQELVRIDDTMTDDRWPSWNQAASKLGVRSVLSAPLVAGNEPIGAMKVYCEQPNNYGSHDEAVLRLLAAQAAILLANSQSLQQARRLSRQLTEALTSRDAVAQATGALMAQGATDQQDAFMILADAARQSGRSVEDVARAFLTALTARNSDSAGSGLTG